ncbi:MAG TPA: ferredoxin--nitrite reductase [Nitratifractor sp.]|nr:ferredoxin--nitrite reductase [Nitratifractor sp.]HHH21101.1 ferredoxin--nitrite reductase [Nitratifractor sp.]
MVALQEAHEARSKKINKVEKIKTVVNPDETLGRLEAIASAGWDNMAKEDSAFYLKCFGFFAKKGDFMLRVRIPGGKLTAKQALKIGEVSKQYGNDYIDLTTRMQVELRYIKIENIATVAKELDSVGITTYQTGVDNFRNIVTDPLDGYAHDSIIETQPLLMQMQEVFLKKSEYIGTLPRKFNGAILGSLSNSCNIYGHDCSFVLAQKDGRFGFNLYLGGKVGVQSKCANTFVEAKDLAKTFEGIVNIFKKYGYRDNRNKNRLHYLLADVGIATFMEAVFKEIGLEHESAGVKLVQSMPINFGTNKILTKDGKYAYKLTVPSGIFSGSDMIEASKTSTDFGDGNLRLSYDQNVWILGVENGEEFLNSTIASKYSEFNNIYFNDMIACAGTKTCSFGVIPNKPDAIEMSHFLNNHVPIANGSVRINWSACPKGCGVHGVADIGLEGCKAKDSEGNRVDGVHIFFGGKITKEAKEAKVLHKSLPLADARWYIKNILQEYKIHKSANESFEEFEERFFSNYSYSAIAFANAINFTFVKSELETRLRLEAEPKSHRNEEAELFYFGLKLFKLLTGESRFDGVDGLEPIKAQPRKISEDEVSKINTDVPLNISKAIYAMTHEDISKRAKVFTEILTIINQ